MAFKNLNTFINALEKEEELIRINTKVSSKLEISEINDRLIKNNSKALLFENVEGSEFPVLVNATGSIRRIEIALGVKDIDDLSKDILNLFEILTSPKENILSKIRILPQLKEISSWLPKRSNKKGSCQEVTMENVDLSKIPILTTWPFDGGPFITFPVVHTISEENNSHNMGMYRMQVFDNQSTGMHWHLHKGGANHYTEYKQANKLMPITVTLGGDPAYTYSATAPLPEEIDEYILAGFLRKKAVKLVKSITNDIWIPEDVDFVLEGFIDPKEDKALEGPFGDHTGYYSLADYYPTFHITHITHRKNAIFPATVVGIPPQEDAFIGLATERIFLAPIKKTMVPEIVDMHMPIEGVFHNIVLNSINVSYPGQSMKVMNSLWGAGQMMFNKYLIILDKSVKLTDYNEVLKHIVQNTDPVSDILFSRGPMDVLDHASEKFALGGKMGIDATLKTSEQESEIVSVEVEKLKSVEGIIDINNSFTDKNIGLLIIKTKKSKNIARNIAKEIVNKVYITGVKFVVFVEEKSELNDLADLVWRVANNSDPNRDCFYQYDEFGKALPILFIDGLRKTLEDDNFQREWPNIVCMDEDTIALVDKRWYEYGIGRFIESPSIKYRKQLYKGEAVAE
jgi:4-hydroxy-3-polyprenylbenzoate decarboxylase